MHRVCELKHVPFPMCQLSWQVLYMCVLNCCIRSYGKKILSSVTIWSTQLASIVPPTIVPLLLPLVWDVAYGSNTSPVLLSHVVFTLSLTHNMIHQSYNGMHIRAWFHPRPLWNKISIITTLHIWHDPRTWKQSTVPTYPDDIASGYYKHLLRHFFELQW